MFQLTLENLCIATVIGYTIAGWLVLTGIKLNYGRLSYSLVKIQIDPRFGWFFFEVPNLVWAYYFLFVKDSPMTLAYALFIIHYINRDIIYPLTLKSTTPVPLEIMLSAFTFTFANGYLQGIASIEESNTPSLIQVIGMILFFGGMAINVYSDRILQQTKEKLQKQKQKRYVRIDQFLFKYVANPNYLGEIIEWIGYAMVSGHIYAFMFVFSTFNVLTPAAIVRSRWNKKNISNYPQERKAIFPLIL